MLLEKRRVKRSTVILLIVLAYILTLADESFVQLISNWKQVKFLLK